ncbi:hypothetical protein [Streptomyces sp. NPDC059003]|uniref:terpene synthase family protein n=1 Tax=Streptomyces sp. NPDC059003 TaxID=3346691 RepID=UPI0036B6F6C7
MPLRAARAIAAMPSPGTLLTIPETGITLPVLRHPDNDAAQRCLNVIDRPYITACLNSHKAADAFIAAQVPTYAGLIYPHALPDRFVCLQRMMNTVTLMNEEFGDPATLEDASLCEQLRTCYLAALEGTRPPRKRAAARLLYETLRPIMAEISPRVGTRLLHAMREQISLLAGRFIRHVDTLTLQRYVELRRIEAFGYWLTTLGEYALGFDMTDDLAANPSLRAARDAAIDSVLLVNDLFSFHKEIQIGEARNALWIVMREDDLSLQAAIDKLARMCGDTQRRYLAACRTVETRERADLRAYLTELGHLISGNLDFHTFSSRYYSPDSDTDRFSSGEMVISTFPGLRDIASEQPLTVTT